MVTSMKSYPVVWMEPKKDDSGEFEFTGGIGTEVFHNLQVWMYFIKIILHGVLQFSSL